MGNDIDGALPHLRFAGETFRFDPVSPSAEHDGRAFIPNRGGGHDLSLTNGYSGFYFGNFGVMGTFGGGIFLSRYAPKTLVPKFSRNAEGNPNGLIQNEPAGATTKIGKIR